MSIRPRPCGGAQTDGTVLASRNATSRSKSSATHLSAVVRARVLPAAVGQENHAWEGGVDKIEKPEGKS